MDNTGWSAEERLHSMEAQVSPAEDEPAQDGDPEQDDKKSKKSAVASSLISWGKTILTAVVLAILIKSFVIVNASVVSGSMKSTIMINDRLICSRLAYIASPPQRLDIIAFDFIENGEKSIYVKRIIGLPGETVTIEHGKVYINDSTVPLPDGFTNETPVGSFGPFTVPEDCYFVLGDNRNDSYDSKSWDDPFLPRKQILGKAWFRYYPSFKQM